MDLWNCSRQRLLCAEPLEGRWLLSALTPQPAAASSSAPSHTSVIVMELDDPRNDPPDVQLNSADLPARILAAINGRFPGAQLLSASFSRSDGPPEYTVETRFDGQAVEVTLTPGGRIKETGLTVTSNELPQEVLEWVRQNFPTAQIDQAAFVTKLSGNSYDLVITSPGQQVMEASLRLHTTEATNSHMLFSEDLVDASDETPEAITQASAADATWLNSDALDGAPTDASTTTAESGATIVAGQATSPQPVVPRNDAPLQTTSLQSERPRSVVASIFSQLWSSQPIRTVDALRALIASAHPAAQWLPQVAGILSDAMPVDVDAIEQRIDHLLGRIDSLAKTSNDDAGMNHAVSRVAIVAALVAAAHLLVLESRRPRGGPLLVFSAVNSSWSWVLGAGSTRRSRFGARRTRTWENIKP